MTCTRARASRWQPRARPPSRRTTCERLWLHVDAAYGGFAALTATGRAALAGIERADSVTLDPHKWLYQPMECGCVLSRAAGCGRCSPRRDDGVMRPDPDDKPVLPAQTEDETGIGWGEAPEPDDDERLRQERPPHWDQ